MAMILNDTLPSAISGAVKVPGPPSRPYDLVRRQLDNASFNVGTARSPWLQ